MAKTYIDIVKYMIEARFEILGQVEKPDIIGAVFGQTEGLLGGGLDLRELQKNGKIGRIEIESATSGNKTFGKLFLPSSLGRVETCILGAAIESVDRVGPFETNFKVNKIEDTRSEKRKKIVVRAKDLLKSLLTTEIPDSKEISELVEADVKSSVVTTYGPESLSAGPGIANSDEVILVEGRADVINLLRNDIENCIAIGGALGSIPRTIIELTKSKDTTLFVDGDRGGDMIIKSLLNVAEIDYIARAPDGKEVEELTRKDIIKSLRSRIPIEQVFATAKGNSENPRKEERMQNQERENRYQHQRPAPEPARQQTAEKDTILSPNEISRRLFAKEPSAVQQVKPSTQIHEDSELDIKDINEPEKEGIDKIPFIEKKTREAQSSEVNDKFVSSLSELHNTLRGRLYDNGGNIVHEVPIRELIQAVQDSSNINTIVFDGIITQRLIELANKQGIKAIYGIRAGQISRVFESMLLYTTERGKL